MRGLFRSSFTAMFQKRGGSGKVARLHVSEQSRARTIAAMTAE